MQAKRCECERDSRRDASSIYEIDIRAEPRRMDSLYVCHTCQGLFRYLVEVDAATDRDLACYSDYLAWSAREADKQKASDAEYVAWVAAWGAVMPSYEVKP